MKRTTYINPKARILYWTVCFIIGILVGMVLSMGTARAEKITLGQPHTAQAMTYCDNADDAKAIAEAYVEGGVEEGRKKLLELALGKSTCSRTRGYFTPEEQVATYTKGEVTINVIRITDMVGGKTWFALTQHEVVKSTPYKVERAI